jgi:hypothetical protein
MTDDGYIDPSQPDPRYPDRPTHPDFAVLANVLQGMDLRASVTSIQSIVEVDETSLLYAIRNRLGILNHVTNGKIKPTPLMEVLYLDAFTLGAKYAEARHTP